MEFMIALAIMDSRIVWDMFSALMERAARLFDLLRICERRWRLTDNWAFAGMKSWKIVESSDGRNAERTRPFEADGEPYPPRRS